MILLNIKLYDLDIGSQVREMSQKLSGIIFYAPGEYFPPISRDPDEVVFGAINAVGTLAESHTATSYRISPRLDSRYITSREAGWFSWQSDPPPPGGGGFKRALIAVAHCLPCFGTGHTAKFPFHSGLWRKHNTPETISRLDQGRRY